MNLRIFSKTVRPSSIAFTMLAKLSSNKIMSAASLATSVPDIPIAIPISAIFSAGASFTPSPVTATISFFRFRAFTTCIFCSAVTRAKMISGLSSARCKCAAVIFRKASPCKTSGLSDFIRPICRAIATAVCG